MSVETITVRDDTPPEMLEVLIAAECYRAKRCVPRGRRFTDDPPTAWDLAHERLNELITDRQRRVILDALDGA